MGATAACFMDSGRYVIVGYEDGKISIINSERAEEIISCKDHHETGGYMGSPISALLWVENKHDRKTVVDIPDHTKHLKSIHVIDQKTKPETIEKIQLLSDHSLQSCLLYSADASLRIQVLWQGHFPLAQFFLKDLLPQNTFAQSLIVKIKKLASTESCD